MQGHEPVLLQQVLEFLRLEPGGRYLDGTVGLGGHSLEMLRACGGDLHLLGLDRDGESLLEAERLIRKEGFAEQVVLRRARFSRFEEHMAEVGWDNLHGVLLDLGVSSLQLEKAHRGLSLHKEGPLDMRLNSESSAETAFDLVNRASGDRLRRIIKDYGEEPMAGRIVKRVLDRREKDPIRTTTELAELVKEAYPARWRRKARNHPATRTFQALRIAVNSELEELTLFLQKIPHYLRSGGRLAIISFHSLEDRAVKQAFKQAARGCVCPEKQMVCTCEGIPRLEIVTKKPVIPGEGEIARNRRSRSAKLRVAQAPAREQEHGGKD